MPQDYNFDTRISELQKMMGGLLDDLVALEQELQAELAKLPDGKIYSQNRNGQYAYRENVDGRIRYISLEETEKIVALSKRRYYEILLHQTEVNRYKIQRAFVLLNQTGSMADVFLSLSEGIRKVVSPILLSSDQFAKNWSEEEYPVLSAWDEDKVYVTNRQEKVRSKSELMTANLLSSMDLKYHYEKALFLGTRTIYPDFTILDVRTRKEVYFEHFGLMDHLDYVASVLKKLQDYENAGYRLGIDVLCYFESSDLPYSLDAVRQLLQERFSEF